MVMVLAFMALSIPLITATLGLASTLSIDSRVKTNIAKGQYSVIGGDQHAIYRILYEQNYVDSIQEDVPDIYTVTLNGEQVEITVLKLSDPLTNPPPPDSDNSRRLQASKSGTPSIASADTPTTFTITVENRDAQPENLRKIHDGLPPGFSYGTGSTSGVTSAEPSIVVFESEPGGPTYQQLTWNLATLSITLQPGESRTLIFNAQASVAEGSYCNEAWAEPGGEKTGTGPTAAILVDSPATALCPGQAMNITKVVEPSTSSGNTMTTYTYTITVENTGLADLELEKIRDLLPVEFLYTANSAAGDITTAEPATTMFKGRQRLDWDFSTPKTIAPGQTRILTFDAQAAVEPGDYWNEIWLTFSQFAYPAYSWPTAVVEAMGVFETTTTDGQQTTRSEVWVGADSYFINQWGLTR